MANLVAMAQRQDRIMDIILKEDIDDVQKQLLLNVYSCDVNTPIEETSIDKEVEEEEPNTYPTSYRAPSSLTEEKSHYTNINKGQEVYI